MTNVVKYIKENPVEVLLASAAVYLTFALFSHDVAWHIHTPLCPHYWVFGA
jgi:hypothetical protein